MTTNPDPVGKLALELLLEGVLDLNHVALTARNDDANKSLVVCSETFHCLLHLQCKIPRLVSDYSHCQLHNSNIRIKNIHNCIIQGGPAKVKPTYIFAGNVWYLNV